MTFLHQLMAHARPEDVAIGISTSGGSRNIVVALEEARKRKSTTIALLGSDSGEIARALWRASPSSFTAFPFSWKMAGWFIWAGKDAVVLWVPAVSGPRNRMHELSVVNL